ncbi:endo-1,4-beta-xylanase precursor [Aspergillus ellipticus CBS 707.79]|uniref:Endo-1,4-beta-xylanase n=1 Tax=Aspergillus ellipticus CBS 707.79 TaxID=1448320 RepID=A0A319D363_9EURO|nr:endo-1,4-beta-xylanase precursor [Aspergillus ellipticus CBS 707.79]
MLFASHISAILSILGALAVAIVAGPVDDHRTRKAVSPERLQWIREAFANTTETVDNAGMSKRATTFSTSQDGHSDSGEFELGWSMSSEAELLGGKGYKGGSTRSLTWDGYFTAEGDWTLAIYGWTLDPVTEWYIVESHGTGTPGNGDILGQVDSDDGVYDVYSLPYNNVPEIYGVTSFNQYWSVRRSHRTTGTVDVSAHFARWKELGLEPGSPIFQMVTLEGLEGEGFLDFTVS